tara:strand:+ start:6733 stop:6930 length:198 start_codon:yes stop_codon:yes gene_type:complete
MKYMVYDVEFDFTDSMGEITPEYKACINYDTVGVWEAEDEDDLIEEITTASGWCIKSIDYEVQLK